MLDRARREYPVRKGTHNTHNTKYLSPIHEGTGADTLTHTLKRQLNQIIIIHS